MTYYRAFGHRSFYRAIAANIRGESTRRKSVTHLPNTRASEKSLAGDSGWCGGAKALCIDHRTIGEVRMTPPDDRLLKTNRPNTLFLPNWPYPGMLHILVSDFLMGRQAPGRGADLPWGSAAMGDRVSGRLAPLPRGWLTIYPVFRRRRALGR